MISIDDKKALLALIWGLKASDLSILLAMLNEPKESQIGLRKGSGHHIFWSKLTGLGLAQEMPSPVDPSAGSTSEIVKDASPEFLAVLKNLGSYALTSDGKGIVAGGVNFALNTGWPPQESIIIPQVVQMLEQYSIEGSAESENKLGVLFRDGKGVKQDYAEALKWFHRSAEKGEKLPHNNIGIMYAGGLGVEKDFIEAGKWFLKAAELGSTGAMESLGVLYATGQGVPQDFSEAAKWWRKSADRGYGLAQCRLGNAYAQGLGIEQDNLQSYMWFCLGIANGIDVRQQRDFVAAKLTPTQIKEANLLVSQWKPIHDGK